MKAHYHVAVVLKAVLQSYKHITKVKFRFLYSDEDELASSIK